MPPLEPSGGNRLGRACRAAPAEKQREMGHLRAGRNNAPPKKPRSMALMGAARQGHVQPDSTGAWMTSDVAWAPSLQDTAPPHRWCPLTAGTTCVSPAADAAALADTTHAVNLHGRRHRRRPPPRTGTNCRRLYSSRHGTVDATLCGVGVDRDSAVHGPGTSEQTEP